MTRRSEENELRRAEIDATQELIRATQAQTAAWLNLRRAIADRPTKGEIAHRRRVVIFGLILFGLMLALSGDIRTENCGIGYRISRVFDAFLEGDRDAVGLRREARQVSPWCDLAFPTSAHTGARWPTPYNAAGLALYGLVVLGLGVFAMGPLDWRKHDTTAEEIEEVSVLSTLEGLRTIEDEPRGSPPDGRDE